ncbi:MAG: peptidoglycan-binding protein [Rhizobiaceae bacterium]|nr:peptidoglycan-binding protein [Rhizobiaceae bacterium]
MKRSARSRKAARAGFGGLLRDGLALGAGAALRNPAAVGGATAFAVTLAYVAANALYYQPHAHTGAYFSTRVTIAPQPASERFSPQPAETEQPRAVPPARSEDDDVSSIIGNDTTAAAPRGDPKVRLVQEVLKTLDLYAGTVDGLTGPQTSKAVERYQKIVGLAPTGMIDAALLSQLGAGDTTAALPARDEGQLPAAAPVPKPKAGTTGAVVIPASAPVQAVHAAQPADPMVVRIQAGLKAFGHDAIELDGIVGARTRAAILEFQSLFGLPETGQPDSALLTKMREVGLTE